MALTDHRVIINMSDWESASDKEKEDKKEDASEVGGVCLFLPYSVIDCSLTGITGSGSKIKPHMLAISQCIGSGTNHPPISPNPWSLCNKPT